MSYRSISVVPDGFPASIDCPLGGQMRPRHWLPHAHCAPSRPFVIYWSDRWSYGRLYPTPTADELARFYGASGYASYLGGDAGVDPPHRKGIGRRLIESLVYRIAAGVATDLPTTAEAIHAYLGEPSDICDVGCASGVLVGKLAALGHRVVGVEPNADARQLGLQRGIEIHEGTGEDLSRVSSRRFDLVTMFQSLEHTTDPFATIRNCISVLKPGGVLWAEVPNHGSAGFAMRGPVWFHTDAGRHMHFFSRASLEEAMKQAGLTCIAARFSGYLAQFYWLDAEVAVWNSLYADSAVTPELQRPPKPSEASLLRLLWATRFATPERRCDSVTILARKPVDR